MGPEEEKCNSIGIVRSSKKQKQKKVPQRGLGVAQLEKIRLEEQQKKDHGGNSVILKSPPPQPPPPPISSPSASSIPIPNYHSSFPYPSDISSPNSILRPQNLDFVNNSNATVPLGWQSVSVHANPSNNKIWSSCDFNLENSNSIWPLHSFMQRSQCHLSPPPSMMNASSTTSSPSPLLNLHMELPSNQNYYANYAPLWPEEEKMVGMKRPYPFAGDNSCKFPTIIHPIGRSDESSSFANGLSLNFTSPNLHFREAPSCSDWISEAKQIPKKNKKEKGDFNGDFLTLAPPPPTFTSPNSKFKPSSAYLAFHNYESFDFSPLPYQGIKDPIVEAGSIVPNQLQPYYTFLPPAIMQIGQPTKSINNYNCGEVGENVDLNLKL